jgi:hypothetical protein
LILFFQGTTNAVFPCYEGWSKNEGKAEAGGKGNDNKF